MLQGGDWQVYKGQTGVLQRKPAVVFWCCWTDTQHDCRSLITAGFFEEAASQQGQLPTGQAMWKEVRGRMAAATGARSALVQECPASCIGALLSMLLQQVSYEPTHTGYSGV